MGINQETIEEIKKLSLPEKVLIVEEIWNSIAQDNAYPELSDEQQTELNRRIESYHANPEQGKTWNEIKKNFMKSR